MYLKTTLKVKTFKNENLNTLEKELNKFLTESVEGIKELVSVTHTVDRSDHVVFLFYKEHGDGSMLIKED